MSRTAQIYATIRTRADGVRERVQLMPAANGITSETPFPKYTLISVSGGGVSFDKYPTGLIKNDERVLRFHLDNMFDADPVLTDYILDPVYQDYVNVWTISDDGGDSGLPVSEFPVRFVGIQIAQPSEEYSAELSGVEVTIKILHVARYLAERSVPEEIADVIIAQTDIDFIFKTAPAHNLWDEVYDQEDGTRVAVVDSGRFFDGAGRGVYNQCAAMMKFPCLFIAVQRWMQRMYARITHTEMNEVRWKDGGIPTDTCYFGSPDLTWGEGSHATRVAIADSLLSADKFYEQSQLWFAALIFEEGRIADELAYIDADGFFTVVNDVSNISVLFLSAKIIGGYLFDDDMFRSYTSVHDWLMDIASNFMCKITYSLTATGIVELCCLPLRAETPIVLSKSDFVREAKPFKRNADAIRGCDAEVVGVSENDVSQIEYFNPGSAQNRPEGNIKALFHNCPSAADASKVSWAETFHPFYIPELQYPFYDGSIKKTLVIKRDGFRCNVLYCDKDSSKFNVYTYGRQFVRSSASVVLTDGVSSYDRLRGDIVLPVINDGNGSVAEKLFQGWAKEIQMTDCLPYAVCLANTQMFSNTMLYGLTGNPNLITLSDCGKTYDISDFIHPALEGKTPSIAVLTKVVENRDSNNNLLPVSVELFAFSD